ncbi:hypothetical protein, partial [uncultured Phocaeicola sp.]|uniref:hypothetical protein n=1 Tax=uncultured Phocaeicola sp. TaxID=990718 RepID=UPI00260CF823
LARILTEHHSASWHFPTNRIRPGKRINRFEGIKDALSPHVADLQVYVVIRQKGIVPIRTVSASGECWL